MPMDILQLREALKDRAADVARHLYPKGKKDGHNWKVGSIAGEPGDSFSVCIEGSKAGVWTDFAGEKGDNNLVELWRRARNIDFREAVTQSKLWLGVRDDPPFRKPGGRAKIVYKKPDKSQIAKPTDAVKKYLEGRGITLATLKAFKIASTSDGLSIAFPYIDEGENKELQMIKYLGLERDERGKKKVRCSKETKKVLFGKHLITADDNHLYITEGEIDAMTLRQLGYCAVSVPFGAKHEGEDGTDPNEEWIENDWDMLSCFERIYLCFDNDEEGRKARQSILKRLGRERCYLVDFTTGKDANELLAAGKEAEIHEAIKKGKTQDPEQLRGAGEYIEEVASLFFDKEGAAVSQGIPFPFETPTGTFHFRMSEVTVMTGFSGSGKTQFLNYLASYLVNLGQRLMIGSFEVPVAQTIRFQVSQVIAREQPRDRHEVAAAIGWLAQGVWFYDHIGNVNRKELLEGMRYAARRYGVKFFYLDSFMKCGIKTDDWNEQKDFMSELTAFAAEFDVHVLIVVHSKKKDDERGMARKMDVKGAGEITDMAHNIFTCHRNKAKEGDIKKLRQSGQKDASLKIFDIDTKQHDATIGCEKQRNGNGTEPEWRLWFDPGSRQFLSERKIPVPFLPEEEYYRFLQEQDEHHRKEEPATIGPDDDNQPF